MRRLLGFLYHWRSWRSLWNHHRNFNLILWTTINWLFWFIRKWRMQRRFNGRCFLIRWSLRYWNWSQLSIQRSWPKMQIFSRWCRLQNHRIYRCPTKWQWRPSTSCRPSTNLNCYWCWKHHVILIRYLLQQKLRNLIRPRSLSCWLWSLRINPLLVSQKLLGRIMGRIRIYQIFKRNRKGNRHLWIKLRCLIPTIC